MCRRDEHFGYSSIEKIIHVTPKLWKVTKSTSNKNVTDESATSGKSTTDKRKLKTT